MRNKTTKKYKHNNIKTRKIRGGGGMFDGITGFFQSTTNTNREISQIKELQNKLAQNMQELTSTYKNVYTKVTNLNNKIQNLSQQQGYESGEQRNESVDSSRQNMSGNVSDFGSVDSQPGYNSGNIQQGYNSGNIQQGYNSGNIQQGYNSGNNSRENMSGNVSEFESVDSQLNEGNEGNGAFDGGKRKSRRKHRARKR
jgi:hypothetical protein